MTSLVKYLSKGSYIITISKAFYDQQITSKYLCKNLIFSGENIINY